MRACDHSVPEAVAAVHSSRRLSKSQDCSRDCSRDWFRALVPGPGQMRIVHLDFTPTSTSEFV